jgi:macrodomain Ter protein organizer (MatP/YcbG family)
LKGVKINRERRRHKMAATSKGISLDDKTWERLQAWADKEGRSLSNAADRLLNIQLDIQEKGEK